MSELAYDSLFFRFRRPPDADAWSNFAIDQVECHGVAPSLISGKKSGWVKAPNDRATLVRKISASNNRSIQGGKNPRSDDPIDGWGIYAKAIRRNHRVVGWNPRSGFHHLSISAAIELRSNGCVVMAESPLAVPPYALTTGAGIILRKTIQIQVVLIPR